MLCSIVFAALMLGPSFLVGLGVGPILLIIPLLAAIIMALRPRR
jgi:hypothetical protein